MRNVHIEVSKNRVARSKAANQQEAGKLQEYTRWIWRIVNNRVFVFAMMAVFLGLVAYWRYPTYLDSPNFYAEDGTVFAKAIWEHGFLQSLFTAFNGYFIVGIYLLEGLAALINNLFLGGSILKQPQALAIVSYAFWGGVSSLPILLFWRDLRHKNWLLLICIALALVQLPSFNYAILGTVGNYKFAFLFVAFLLLIKRNWLPTTSRWFYVIDAALLVCAFTNATVYLLLPLALLRYLPPARKFTLEFSKKLVRNKSFLSLVALGALVATQIIFIVMNGGVPELKGYLDEPFEFSKMVEIFIERTFLFPFVYLISPWLNDVFVGILFAAGACILWRISPKPDRPLLYFGAYAAFVGTALFVSQRTGVSQFFSDYHTSGTDHFFYAQNWIFLFTAQFIIARFAETKNLGRPWRIATASLLVIVPITMLLHNDFGKNTLMERSIGSLEYAAQVACNNPHGEMLELPVYPAGSGLKMSISSAACTDSLAEFTPDRVALPLAPANNQYVEVTKNELQQTFLATHNGLSGVSIFFSTFGSANHNTYTLTILDATCSQPIRTTNFSAKKVHDNSYFDIRIPLIADSKNKTYCFAVTPLKLEPGKPVLAQQLSAPSLYAQGAAIRDGKALSEDTVFDLLYR